MNKKKLAINIFFTLLFPILAYLGAFVFSNLIWIAFIPLLFIIEKNSFQSSLLFYPFSSILIAVLSAYWVISYDNKLVYLLLLYIGSFFLIFSVLISFFFSRIKSRFVVIVPGVLYICLFKLYSLTKVGEYWFNLALMKPRFSFLTQYLGELGIMFFILLVNTLLFLILINRERIYFLVILFFVIIFLYSGFFYGSKKTIEGRRVRVAVIQANFNQDWDWRSANASGLILDKYFELSREAIKQKPDLVVWPEYAIPLNLAREKEVYQKISDFAKEQKINLILGSRSNDGIAEEDGQTHFFDSAYVFNREGGQIGRYDAIHPFPYNSSNNPGEGYLVFNTDVGKIGVLICYDEVFDKTYRDYNKLGVDFFVAISNNGPVTDYYTMHWLKYFSELRAATFKKYVIRSTNTGFSQVIDPFGNVIDSIPIKQEGVMVTDFYLD